MRVELHLDVEDIVPGTASALRRQGIPHGTVVSHRITELSREATELFHEAASPAGILSELSVPEFDAIFVGEGQNAQDAVLQSIYPRAANLALYALTMGAEVSRKIEALFDQSDFALGYMLDAVASLAAERAVTLSEKQYSDELAQREPADGERSVLSYSPGYCGWHISGQKKLFERLKPARIGITLNDSYLMTPIKSVTGLLVAGEREIHFFTDAFSFCRTCKDHTCLDRIRSL
ncbi:MAG: vitamin B12 dependent-methionine synthase activation domain-containing protein [Acidobacteriota bacterium]